MVIHTCNYCGKNIKDRLSAKHHLENRHKREILKPEVQQIGNSLKCVYCDKSIEGSIESHLRSHIKKIITLFFDTYMSKSSSLPSI
jgi:hypothetical protein